MSGEIEGWPAHAPAVKLDGLNDREVDLEARRKRVPEVVAGCNLRELPLSPVEAYLHSRIDGSATEAELATTAGLDALSVAFALDRLATLGAVRFKDDAPKRP